TPDDAKDTVGSGVLLSISGQLEGPVLGLGEGDFEDMYLVQLSDPVEFFASTIEQLGGFTEFNSRVFIFDIDGIGILGNDNAAAGGPGGDFVGACCLPNGTCQDNTSAGECGELGGEFQGPGTNCESITCPPTGACCFISASLGECAEYIESFCVQIGGFYNGDGTACDKGGCQLGACCMEDDSCLETSYFLCLVEFTGTYQGNFVDCEDANCAGLPTGACCLNEEECVDDLTAAQCTAQKGEYQGDGSICSQINCGPVGACCFEGPECVDGFTQDDCVASGGAYQGDDTFCEGVTCPDGEGSTIGNEANDGSGAMIDTPGLYYVAITTSAREPVSAGGPIFFFASSTEISGPDGPGGDQPIIGWQDVPIPEGAEGPDVPGLYTIALNGTEFSTAEVTASFKKPECPAPVNIGSNGVLKVMLAGTTWLDVMQIDQSTIRLRRADGLGGEAMPNDGPPGPKIQFKDLVTPSLSGEDCNCDVSNTADGLMDLEIPFRASALADALDLHELPAGASVPLVLSAQQFDGTPVEGRDCVLVLPDAPVPSNLFVRLRGLGGMRGAGMMDGWVEISPFDARFDDGGFGQFERAYTPGTIVTLTAEPVVAGRSFAGWRVDGRVVSASRTIHRVITSQPLNLEAWYVGGAGRRSATTLDR
ncbi:MAG: hypothetical protein ACYTGG_03515, partial [Planctomycetota bacterium]